VPLIAFPLDPVRRTAGVPDAVTRDPACKQVRLWDYALRYRAEQGGTMPACSAPFSAGIAMPSVEVIATIQVENPSMNSQVAFSI
jgi:hypothetical protein